MGLEESLEALGTFGSWQIMTFMLVCIVTHFPAMWQLYAIVFVGYPNPYHCVGKQNVFFDNGTIDQEMLRQSVPWEKNLYGQLAPAGCTQYVNYTMYGNKTEDCSDWYIEPDWFDPDRGTFFMEWNLVCEKEIYVMYSQIIFGVGVLLGFFILGPLDDLFGRKPMLFYCLFLMNLFGAVMAFSPSFEWLCIFQFLTGFFASNLYLCGFVIACELYPTSIRSVTATSTYFFESLGIATLPLWAHFIRDWRTLQFAFSIASFPFLLYYWWCPESLRWLLSNGRLAETKSWLQKAAKFNGVKVPEEILTKKFDYGIANKYLPEGSAEKITFLQYNKHSKLLAYTVIFFYLWNVVTLIQFGISYLNAVLAGNIYINFALFGIVEIGGILLSTMANQIWGRRYPLIGFNFLAALCLGTAAVLDYMKGQPESNIPVIMTTVFTIAGKFAISGSTCSVAVYVQEIYPTEIRGTAVGFMFGAGFISGLLAPISIFLARTSATYIPIAAFAVMALLAAIVVYPLPETHFRDLPETIEEVLAWPRAQSKQEWQELRDIVKRRKQERKVILKNVLANSMTDGHGKGGIAGGTENGPETVTHPPSKMAFSNPGYTVDDGVVKL